MNLIVQLIVGGVIGWLASMVMKTNAQMGLVANVLVGVAGSMLGFWLAGLLGLQLGQLREIDGVNQRVKDRRFDVVIFLRTRILYGFWLRNRRLDTR